MPDRDGVPWLVAEALDLLAIAVEVGRLGSRVVEIRVGERHDGGNLRNPRLQVICGEVEDDESLDFALPTSSPRKSWLGSMCCCCVAAEPRRLSL